MSSDNQSSSFIGACFKEVTHGSLRYYAWLGFLALLMIPGAMAYWDQLQNGLGVTGMSDQVSWGTYIANFTYLVGLAAAAVMLVIPAYIFHNKHARTVVLIAEGLAVSACIMALCFVVVDMGHPERFWHLIPVIGRLNWPMSMLSWDVLVLNGYLVLNISIPIYVLYQKFHGKPYRKGWFLGLMVLSIFWAISIHTVTAFLFSSNSGRTFWHTALLGPRFLASAFAAGPAFMLIALRIMHDFAKFEVPKEVVRLLAIVVAVALQVNLFMLGAEIFTEFYNATSHSASAQYLFVGLDGHTQLLPWMYSAISMEIIALVVLMIEPLRKHGWIVFIASSMTCVGVWIEKGMGLIIPGFIPSPIGEILEYAPSSTEVLISLSIWALGFFVFTLLAKPAIAIETGRLRLPDIPSKTPPDESPS